jgi:hypothetical protein
LAAITSLTIASASAICLDVMPFLAVKSKRNRSGSTSEPYAP